MFTDKEPKMTVSKADWVDAALQFLDVENYTELSRLLVEHGYARDTELSGYYHYLHSRVLFSEGFHEASRIALELASRIFKDSGNKVWFLRVNARIANDCAIQGDWSSACSQFELCIQNSSDLPQYASFLANILNDYALASYCIGHDPWKSLDLLERAYSISLQGNAPAKTLQICVNGTTVANNISSKELSLHYADIGSQIVKTAEVRDEKYFLRNEFLYVEEIREKSVDVTRIVACLALNHGNTVLDLGDQELAISLYTQAHGIASRNGILDIVASVSNQLGCVLNAKKNYRVAIQYFQEAIDIFGIDKLKSSTTAVVLSNLAESTFKIGLKSESEAYFEESLKMCQELNMLREEAAICANMAELYADAGNYPLCLSICDRALELAKMLNLGDVATSCYRIQGRCLMESDTQKAKELLQLALIIAKERENRKELRLVHRELCGYYKLVGDSNMALMHSEEFHSMSEQIYTEEFERRMADLAILNKLDRYEFRLAKSVKEAEDLKNKLSEQSRDVNGIVLAEQKRRELLNEIEDDIKTLSFPNSIEAKKAAETIVAKIKTIKQASGKATKLDAVLQQANESFVRKIRTIAPNLTTTELKVAISLAQVTDTKKIADILGVSPRSIENHRTHLRRKLGLAHNENLSTFLIRLK